MLRSIKSFKGFRLKATDGDIGHVYDLYFDDKDWIIRYLVAETGNWLLEKKVLLSPASLAEPQWESHEFPVLLTKNEIENSPDVSKDKPISKQKESELAKYYDWPIYWPIGHTGVPPHIHVVERTRGADKEQEEGDSSLRSFREVVGYSCHAIDDDFGHVSDFIVDDTTWSIRYLVISTRTILPGKKVLISPMWSEKIVWSERTIHLSLTKEAIKNSPEFDPGAPINRKYEEELYDYYGRPVYWRKEMDKAATHF
ncbi:PRC-barrel domain containing protein [candidate division KSB1 bacterium]|nr:PRC-barrel domain containing protein [candidate division KSB1 bacterium]